MITLQDVQAAARRLAEADPEKVNPMGQYGKACAYTSYLDPTWHCLAGQILIELGLSVPRENGAINTMPRVTEGIEPAGVEFMRWCQLHADGSVGKDIRDDRVLVPWRKAYEFACYEMGIIP